MVRTRMRKKVAVLAVVAAVAGVARVPGADPAEDGPAVGARSVFFDDFSGPGLDRSKWYVEVTGPTYNDEQ